MKEKKYLDDIDIAKAIGIILVVIGHCIPGKITNFIYLFHMPMFFMITGYVFKPEENWNGYIAFIKRKIKSLYIPFVMFNILFLVLNNLFIDIGFLEVGYNNCVRIESPVQFAKELIKIILLVRMMEICKALWFVRVMFVSIIIYCGLRVVFKKNYINYAIFLLCLIGGYVVAGFEFLADALSQNIILVMLGIAFIALGGLYRVIRSKINLKKHTNIVAVIVSFIILYIFNENGAHINMVLLELSNPVFITLTTLLGTFIVFESSIWLTNTIIKQFLCYIGKNTMPILGLHYVAFKIVNVIYAIKLGIHSILKNTSIYTSPLNGVLNVTIGVIFPLMLYELYKLCENQTGKNRNLRYEYKQ